MLHFSAENEDASEEILEALEPHPNLESLRIRLYLGSTISPNWMMALIYLKSLSLGDCRVCKVLPPLGKLPSLEYLEIWNFYRVERVGVEFLGIENDENGAPRSHQISFPNLKWLLFLSFFFWEKWESGINLGAFKFQSCCSLRELPDFLPKTCLQHLQIKYCHFLKERCREGDGEEWPKISHVPSIQYCPCCDTLPRWGRRAVA